MTPKTQLISAATREQAILVRKAFLTFAVNMISQNALGFRRRLYTSMEARGINTKSEDMKTVIPNVNLKPFIAPLPICL